MSLRNRNIDERNEKPVKSHFQQVQGRELHFNRSGMSRLIQLNRLSQVHHIHCCHCSTYCRLTLLETSAKTKTVVFTGLIRKQGCATGGR
jgi:hypothetical protein